MNFETFVALASVNMSWANAAELGDDKLPPIPISWFKNDETVKEPDWTVVKKKTKRGINTKPLGSKKNN